MKRPKYICLANLMLSTSCEFYFDDFVIVRSLVLRTQSVSAVLLPPFF